MLQSLFHLVRAVDHYADGDWYDAEYVHMRADIPYYAGVAAHADGPLLELACGTGRLTFPMAEAGAEVVGVDLSPPMIDRAERKRSVLSSEVAGRLSFQVGDMRHVRLGRSFAGVVLGFNTIMHMLTDADLEAALATAAAHLWPGGRFYLDLHTPLTDLLVRDPDGRFDPQQMIEPRSGIRYVVTENNRYDPRTQINTMRFYYQPVDADERPAGPEHFTEVRLRVLFPRELDRWLSQAGFAIVEDWDGFERQPFTGQGGRRVLVAERQDLYANEVRS